MICPVCHKDNPLNAKYCDGCKYEFNSEDRDKAYEKTVFGKIDKIIDSFKKLINTANLSIVINNRIFRIGLLVLLVAGGIFLNASKESYAIIPSEEYRVEYNQSLNEYYLYTEDDYINLKLYLSNDISEVVVKTFSYNDIAVSDVTYGVNARIVLNRYTDGYYEIIENDISFKVDIINE